MLAVGIGAILTVLIRTLLIIGVVLSAAYALTTYVELPGFVDAVIWLAAGGCSLLCVVGLGTVLAALIATGKRL